MTDTKILYFAYGSNLSQRQMLRRCPHARFVAKAKLKNYQFAITGHSTHWNGGCATILPARDNEVWGVVYELDEDCLLRLDGFEGIKYRRYTRRHVTCHFTNGKKREAVTYIREPKQLTHSSRKYRNAIVHGALRFGLPHQYVTSLKAHLQ